ncbi:hypothetical protein CH373_10465 [Leptospira perolatii]|uniref:Uncharacterized protein n=1 Tax=Leptospira perolatii TaxID=2023191 RepID=A0A2M9ZMV7_9LEPT|nr:hypothetical protein CH360_17005 [Leptospira perolatii]PJZ73420.1 hypothetical protein CH373_10465 [Leptospira perolatii]
MAFVLFASCGRGYDLDEFLEKKLVQREGKPELFSLNGKSFSADSFRRELLFERNHLELKHDFPSPQELDRYLNQFVEESVILEDALVELDLGGPEAAAYLWPYIRKGIVSYYLDKKSGVFELNDNYPDISIPDEELKEFYEKNKSQFGNLTKEEANKRISNTARFLKWRKLYEARNERKKEIIGMLRKRNSVQIKAGRLNSLGQD